MIRAESTLLSRLCAGLCQAVLLVSYLDRLLVSAQCSASPGGEPGESAPSPAGTEPQALLRARELKLV